MIFSKDTAAIYDLLLLQHAVKYNLNDRKERDRSVKDLERFFFKSIEAIEPDLFLEVGARDAFASSRAKKTLKDKTNVVAYEANETNYGEHKKRLKKEGVNYIHAAVADSSDGVTFKLRVDAKGRVMADGQSSLLEHSEHETGYKEVSVPSVTMDDIFSEHLPQSAVLWVDVEGALGIVFSRYTRKSFKRTKMVFVEVEDRPYWPGQILRHDVDRLFFKQGFIPIARDYQSRYQYNVIYIDKKLLTQNDLFRRRLSEFYSGDA
ncbi:MAG: FkbM family methyltransferase [Patescibacteria group bacterium]